MGWMNHATQQTWTQQPPNSRRNRCCEGKLAHCPPFGCRPCLYCVTSKPAFQGVAKHPSLFTIGKNKKLTDQSYLALDAKQQYIFPSDEKRSMNQKQVQINTLPLDAKEQTSFLDKSLLLSTRCVTIRDSRNAKVKCPLLMIVQLRSKQKLGFDGGTAQIISI